MGRRKSELVAIAGNVPHADDIADVCAFAPRCPWVADECRAARPPLNAVSPGRLTACVRIDQIEREFRPAAAIVEHHATLAPEAEIPDAILHITDLGKSFPKGRGQVEVLSGVSLEVAPGESVGLVGESGSGKTTLARCITGLETPTIGTISVGGLDASNFATMTPEVRRQVRRTVQMVFQNPYASLNPARTVGATLSEALHVVTDVDDRPTVGDLLERVGLPTAFAKRRPAGLSGGERQRVAIARALAVSPRLLICDESVSALDVSVQAQMLNLFGDLQRDLGLAFLFITHDLGVVRQVTDRVYVLNQGVVVEAGATASVLDAPQDSYTQRLLASVPQPGVPTSIDD